MENFKVRCLLNRAEDYDLSFLVARLHAWRFLLFVSGFCFIAFLSLRSRIEASSRDELSWSKSQFKDSCRENPAHGSGRMVQGFKSFLQPILKTKILIPPTAVGGWF